MRARWQVTAALETAPKVLLEFDLPTGGHWCVVEQFGKRAVAFRISDHDEWCEASGDYRLPLAIFDAMEARHAELRAAAERLMSAFDTADFTGMLLGVEREGLRRLLEAK